MRKLLSVLFVLLLVLALALPVATLGEATQAAEGPEASIPWKYTAKGGQATITGYKGSAPVGNVWIPREIDGNLVTAIGKQALASCGDITSVTIPDSVTVIGVGAFASCSGLTSLLIPDGVTTIDNGAFQYCSGLTSVTIPTSVTSIGDGAFAYTSMANVTIPESVVSIGRDSFTRAFHDEQGNVSGFDTPTFVVRDGSAGHQYAINTNSFYYIFEYDLVDGGARLKRSQSGTIPGDLLVPSELDGYPVTGIGDSVFSWWTELTSVTIPSSVTSIGAEAFGGCYGLTVTIPASVTSIAKDAFSGEGYTWNFEEGSYAEQYIAENVISVLHTGAGTPWEYILEEGGAKIMKYGAGTLTGAQALPDEVAGYPVTAIGDYAFAESTALTSLTIPGSVTSIGDWAFNDCSNLTSVTIPASVTDIGRGAFYGCGDLLSVSIPDGVTRIDYRTFNGCSSLTSIVIPDSVTSIGDYAFQYCSGLTSVFIPNSVGMIGEKAFDGCGELVLSVKEGGYAEKYAKEQGIPYRIDGSEGSGEVFTSSIISIAGWEGILVDQNVKITRYTKDKPTGDLVMPNELDGYVVTVIGDEVFYGCDGLTSVTIPDSVTSIGSYAFAMCSGLTSVIIPDNVTSIDHEAFLMCSGLTSVIIGDGVKSIGEMAFAWCESLTSVTIPDGVKSIGIQAFGCCTSLTHVTIPASITSIDHSMFLDCTSLASVTIHARVRSIEDSAFAGCDNLTLSVFQGSYAEQYAISNGIAYDIVEGMDSAAQGEVVSVSGGPSFIPLPVWNGLITTGNDLQRIDELETQVGTPAPLGRDLITSMGTMRERFPYFHVEYTQDILISASPDEELSQVLMECIVHSSKEGLYFRDRLDLSGEEQAFDLTYWNAEDENIIIVVHTHDKGVVIKNCPYLRFALRGAGDSLDFSLGFDLNTLHGLIANPRLNHLFAFLLP